MPRREVTKGKLVVGIHLQVCKGTSITNTTTSSTTLGKS